MSASAPAEQGSSARIFGIPFGDFGLFASVLIATALGFMTFFAVTFFSIFGLLFYDRAGHHSIGLDASYKFIGLPAGVIVLFVSMITLIGVWLRNRLSGRHG